MTDNQELICTLPNTITKETHMQNCAMCVRQTIQRTCSMTLFRKSSQCLSPISSPVLNTSVALASLVPSLKAGPYFDWNTDHSNNSSRLKHSNTSLHGYDHTHTWHCTSTLILYIIHMLMHAHMPTYMPTHTCTCPVNLHKHTCSCTHRVKDI